MLLKFGSWFEFDLALTALFMSFIGYEMLVQRSLGSWKIIDLYREGRGLHLEVFGLMIIFSKESASAITT